MQVLNKGKNGNRRLNMPVQIKGKNGPKNLYLNRKKAIHEKCLDCCCWQPSAVTECPFTKCDLHPFRTGREKQNAKERTKSIKSFCLNCMNGQVGQVSKCQSFDCPLYIYRRGHKEYIIKESFTKKRGILNESILEQRL